MEIRFLLELLLPFLFASGVAVNPGCECLMFTSTFGKEFGVFSTPDYPRPYPSDVDCILYSFVGGSHDIVHITFVEFDVQKTHLDCSLGDRVEVFLSVGGRAGVSEQTAAAGALCGGLADVPGALYSQGPALALAMRAQGPPSNSTGFLGRFRFLDRRSFRSDGRRVLGTECDQLFSSGDTPRSGRFFSPRYPSSYPANTTCKYYFRARENERIRLVFEEVSLQKKDVSCLESEDAVTVHDGASPASASALVLCAAASQLEVLSTGAHLYVELAARAPWPAQGFRAAFHFQERPQPPGTGGDGVETQCGATISSDGGIGGSVAAPAGRSAHARCRFDFEARGRQRARLLITGLRAAAEQAGCDSAEAAAVCVWTDGRLEQLWSGCGGGRGGEQQQLMASGPRMRIEFHGARAAGAPSLAAHYTFVSDLGVQAPRARQLSSWPCAFSLNGSDAARGYVTSPNFPGLYPRDAECHFFFHGRPGQRIALRFVHFDVEGVQPCEALSASDFVEVSSHRPRAPRPRLPRYCGQLAPFDVLSDGSFLRLTFKSNGRLDATGFNATYRFLGGATDSGLARRRQTSGATGITSLWPLILFCWKFVC